jgi:hypothetical protein
MKKILIIGLILSISLLTGCPGPYDNNQQVVLTFEEAVQEVYDMAASTLYYCSDGINMDKNVFNRITGPKEIPGVCTDYSVEFAYYWNEVKNYDEVYGKAYIARVPTSTTFQIKDFIFTPNGTSKLRENTSNFLNNQNDQEMDCVYRDIIYTSIVYTGKNILHYGDYQYNHMWIVIKIGDDWYDTDPTCYDIRGESRWNYYAPIKINF